MPVCELCGKTEFVKEDGMFVCQGCGTKYTPEEAKKLPASPVQVEVGTGGQSPQSAVEAIGGVAVAAITAIAEALASGGEPKIEEQVNFETMDARGVNNYVAQSWQMLVDRYKKFEHPSKLQLDNMALQAKECLVALDNAAKSEPEKYVQNTILYNNCIEIEECVRDLDCYEQKDGEWKRISFPLSSSDLKVPGQDGSWKERRDFFREQIRQEYLGANETDAALLAELEAQAAKIEAELDELKAEKRSKGFFNFAEKGEVKERMKPVKERLSGVQDQIDDVEDRIDEYVEDRLDELGTSFTRLSF